MPTVLREYPELVHGFFGMGGVSAGADKAADELCRDLRDLLDDRAACEGVALHEFGPLHRDVV